MSDSLWRFMSILAAVVWFVVALKEVIAGQWFWAAGHILITVLFSWLTIELAIKELKERR